MEPNFVLDTNILIHLVRDNQIGRSIESRFRLRARARKPLICAVTVGEAYAFAKKLGWGVSKVTVLENLIRQLGVLEIRSRQVFQTYADVDFVLSRSGRSLEQNDIWIAATAMVAGAHLLTTDKDFDPLYPTYLDRTWIDPQQPEA